MKLSKILTIITVVLVLALSMTSCDLINGLIRPDGHVCANKCEECGKCTNAECPEEICADKCEGHEDTPVDPPVTSHTCESKCEKCGKCTDADCSESACADKCEGHEPVATTPVITVVPDELEINAGDDIDLMFGVTVTDEGDEAPKLFISDDEGFDKDTEGVYTITYTAQNKFGSVATATRKITVNKALSALALEVQKNLLGEEKWEGTFLNFRNNEFHILTGDATFEKISGVFYNSTESAITVTVACDYGVVGIINANGVVIEGRDGANGKLVNADYPVRASSSGKVDVNNVAENMLIPAGGYAIVVQNGYCGTTVNNDGRGFMNYNVIYMIGNVVRLSWVDSAEVLTPYVDQAPVITGHNNKVLANLTDTAFDLNAAILGGLVVTDDNGTFNTSDDTTAEIKVVDNGGFDINTVGSYNVTLEATDGANTTTVTRVVEVVDNLVEVKVNDNSYKTLPENIAVDVNIDKLGGYHFLVFTPAFTDTELNYTNGWGEAFVLNQYGQVIRIYDGANGKYYDADNKAGIVDSTKCTDRDYLKQAFASLQDGEYLVVAPNGVAGNTSRAFFLSNRTVGAQMTIPGVSFPQAPHACGSKCEKCGGCLDAECAEEICATKCPGHAHECEHVCPNCGKCTDVDCAEAICAEKCGCHECESVCEHCNGCKDAECNQAACATKCQGHEGHMFVTIGTDKKYEAVKGMWAINETITTATAASKAVWVFTKDYTGEFSTNGYGVAVVLDKYGRIAEVYDGANVGYWLPGGKQASAHFNANTYATTAWAELEEGETLVIFPNGADGNKARQIGLDSRYLFNQKMNITGVEFASTEMTIQIGAKNYTAELGKWAVNEPITTATAASKAIWVFTKDYTGEFSTNGYGVAVVLDKYGRVVRVYDGANGGYWLPDGKQASAHFNVNTYATTAWAELEEGETLVVLPNGGTEGNVARQVGLDCRYLFNQKMSITGIKFASTEMTIQIGAKNYTAELGKWAVNEPITTATAASKAIWVFTKDYTGEFSTNGYGVAVVLDKYGRVAEVYDGANGGYWLPGGKQASAHFNVNTYATTAWAELEEGETLVILPNGGTEGNVARQVGLDCRYLFNQKMSITGFTFE